MKLGATGDFPEGKISEDDEGGLVLAVTYDPKHDLVRIEFGKPVAWLALPPELAIEFATTIWRKAKEGRPD